VLSENKGKDASDDQQEEDQKQDQAQGGHETLVEITSQECAPPFRIFDNIDYFYHFSGSFFVPFLIAQFDNGILRENLLGVFPE
jgi:hypothetical protein